jgi:hypothetical protein
VARSSILAAVYTDLDTKPAASIVNTLAEALTRDPIMSCGRMSRPECRVFIGS